MNCFGVYPLTATVSNAAGTATSSVPVPLPFWPSKSNGCPQAIRPNRFVISWIWPLIDSPHQGPCPGLLDNSLAASLAPGGRLANLLAVGASYAASAHLTWAIDPSLLDDVRTMTGPYSVGTSPTCAATSHHSADPNARKWLANLARATAKHAVFVTPYADVDVAGLAQYGDTPDLRKAFASGQRLAGPLLRRSPVAAPVPAGVKQLSAVAWPSGGRASSVMVDNLGAMRIGTVILAMPPPQLTFTPGAVTSVNDGVGTQLKVLLADYSLRGMLAGAAANSRQPRTIFGVSQLFLAETAMIVAEAPSIQRPILVTPPRRWDPAGTLALDLLGDTVNAPWLRPVPIGQLAAQPQTPAQIYPSLVRPYVLPALPRKVLRQIGRLDYSVALLHSIMFGTDARLNHAVYGIESSRWAGANARRAEVLLDRTQQYIAKQFAGLSVGGQHVIHVTLGGRVGSVTVSIHNSLSYPIQVGLQVASSNNTVMASQRRPPLYEVAAHSSGELKLSVNATQTGKATLKLSLKSPNGTLLPGRPLIMTISATNLGTVALVIFAAALAIFVAASAAQALRRGRPSPAMDEELRDSADPDQPAGEPTEAGSPKSASSSFVATQDELDQSVSADRADNVLADPSELSSAARGSHPTEESR